MSIKFKRVLLVFVIATIGVSVSFEFAAPLIRKKVLKYRIEHESVTDARSNIAIQSYISKCKNPNEALQGLWSLVIDPSSTEIEKEKAGYALSMLAAGQWDLSGTLVSKDSPASKAFLSFMESKLNSLSSSEKEVASRALAVRRDFLIKSRD